MGMLLLNGGPAKADVPRLHAGPLGRCGEHKYLHRRPGCEDDMLQLRDFTADGAR